MRRIERRKRIQESFICAAIMFILAALVVLISAQIKSDRSDAGENKTEETEQTVEAEKIVLWYYDSDLEKYMNFLAGQYKKEKGIELECVKVSYDNYLESINQANIEEKAKPDLYIIDTEQLEKAYLGGLAEPNLYTDIYSTDNYAATALAAVTYKDKMTAYPFSFDTCFMVYNSSYVKKAPATFDDILDYAENFDGEKYIKVHRILDWNVKDIIFNYGFVGNYLECGGPSGDDADVFDVSNDGIKNALKYYKKLAQYFSINIDESDYDTVKKNFRKGSTVYTMVRLDFIKEMAKSKTKYTVCDFPNLTKKLKTKTLSYTNAVVVNPFSEHVDDAELLAVYMTEKNQQKLFDYTGKMSARRVQYKDDKLNKVYSVYENSNALPKLMSTMDFRQQVQIMLNTVWNGGKITTSIKSLNDEIGGHLNN